MNLSKRTIEYFIYFLFWGILFMSPFWGDIYENGSVEWNEVYAAWKGLLPSLALFFINNHFLMPFLLYKKGKRRYILFLICSIVLVYFASVFVVSPVGDFRAPPSVDRVHPKTHIMHPHPRLKSRYVCFKHVKSIPTVHNYFCHNTVYKVLSPPHNGLRDKGLPLHFFHPDNVQILLIVFVLVFNICIRLFFYTVRNDEYLMEVEKQRLSTELRYLKYQINPHFFMNTLNNIHALIDIDKVKAQASLIELSKMMRHILYDASASFVTLAKEIEFIASYIDLMRMRYSDRLAVDVSFPPICADCDVPSLLFVSFIENAFKHGALHNKNAFIKVALSIEDKIVFSCMNSCTAGKKSEEGLAHKGIGIDNIRKRLSLLYGSNYSLDIVRKESSFSVTLKIPLKNDKVYNC